MIPLQNCQSWPAGPQVQIPLISLTQLSCFQYGFLYRIVQSWPAGLQVQAPLLHTTYRTPVFSAWFPLQNSEELACSPPGSDATNSHPLENCRVFVMLPSQNCLKLACRLPGQISSIHTPYTIVVFALWLPSQNCPKLAWSPPGPVSTNSHPLHNSSCFPKVFCKELSKAGLQASISRFH